MSVEIDVAMPLTSLAVVPTLSHRHAASRPRTQAQVIHEALVRIHGPC